MVIKAFQVDMFHVRPFHFLQSDPSYQETNAQIQVLYI